MDLYEYLESIGACEESLEWIRENNLTDPREAWEKASAPDLFWVAMRHAGQQGWCTRQDVILALCDYVEPVLQHISTGEDRSRKVLDAVKAFADGRATTKECRAVTVADAVLAAVAAVARAADAVAAADAASSGLDADFVRSRLTLGEVRYE